MKKLLLAILVIFTFTFTTTGCTTLQPDRFHNFSVTTTEEQDYDDEFTDEDEFTSAGKFVMSVILILAL